MKKSYAEIYKESIEYPDKFWGEVGSSIHWDVPYDKVSDTIDSHHRWFVGGGLNTCYNALDIHIDEGRGGLVALYYDSPVTNVKRAYTFLELRDRVSKVAGVLTGLGVVKGDRVVIYMPMIAESLIAMLACARIGAVHCVVFGGFASHELAIRIDDARPKVIMSASCGVEIKTIIHYKTLLDEAIDKAEYKVEKCLIYQREQSKASMIEGRDLDWAEEESKADETDCVIVDSNDPLYILYTSGTTGKPKGIVRSNGGHCVAMKYSMDKIYNCKQGEVFWAGSDVGWVVGHSYIVYAPLINGCSTVLYEGKPVRTPDAGAFWRVCEEYKVSCLFSAPTAFRAIKKEDPDGHEVKKYDLSNLKTVFVAGERCDSDTLRWINSMTKKPVIDNWWQTETSWPIASNPLGIERLKVKDGSPTKPMPGFNVQILNEAGEVCKSNELGNITLKLPLPPSCLMGIWENEERYQSSYLAHYPGYYLTGDSGYLDEDNYLWVMGRIDGVINVAGHRLSTGEIEEIISSYSSVAECAVIGIDDELKGELPMGFVVLKENNTKSDDIIKKEIISLIRNEIGAVVSFNIVLIVTRLPKTRSGKILRGTMRSIVDKKEWDMPSTIEDPEVLKEIEIAIKENK